MIPDRIHGGIWDRAAPPWVRRPFRQGRGALTAHRLLVQRTTVKEPCTCNSE
jgi:hypothetical protein